MMTRRGHSKKGFTFCWRIGQVLIHSLSFLQAYCTATNKMLGSRFPCCSYFTYMTISKNGMNSSFSFKSSRCNHPIIPNRPSAKQLAWQEIKYILHPKQKQRPLPFLRSLTFFYVWHSPFNTVDEKYVAGKIHIRSANMSRWRRRASSTLRTTASWCCGSIGRRTSRSSSGSCSR